MTNVPRSPDGLKRRIAALDLDRLTVLQNGTIVRQYNPDTRTRTLEIIPMLPGLSLFAWSARAWKGGRAAFNGPGDREWSSQGRSATRPAMHRYSWRGTASQPGRRPNRIRPVSEVFARGLEA